MTKVRVHAACGTHVTREMSPELIKEYGPYVCPECDTNLYTEIETVETEF